jgi:hypothetical protein
MSLFRNGWTSYLDRITLRMLSNIFNIDINSEIIFLIDWHCRLTFGEIKDIMYGKNATIAETLPPLTDEDRARINPILEFIAENESDYEDSADVDEYENVE